jgi:cytoskeleton protein RodZ
MEGLGEFLRKGRQRASLSLEDLSKRTCIRLENLQSMEREDLDSLPSDAYVRGFVRQVCRELNLPPQDGIVRYEMLRASSGPPDEIEWAEDRAEDTAGRLEKAQRSTPRRQIQSCAS